QHPSRHAAGFHPGWHRRHVCTPQARSVVSTFLHLSKGNHSMATEMWVTLGLAVGSYLLHALQAYRSSQSSSPSPSLPPMPQLTPGPVLQPGQTPSSPLPPLSLPGHLMIGHGELLNLLISALMTPPPLPSAAPSNLPTLLAAVTQPAIPK